MPGRFRYRITSIYIQTRSDTVEGSDTLSLKSLIFFFFLFNGGRPDKYCLFFVLFCFVLLFLGTQRSHSRRIKCINNNNNKNIVKSSLSIVAQLGFAIDKLNTVPQPRYISSFRTSKGFE